MEKTSEIVIKQLEEKYKDDTEVIELIERTKKDIEYIEKKELQEGYKGQTSAQHLLEFEAFLEDWY